MVGSVFWAGSLRARVGGFEAVFLFDPVLEDPGALIKDVKTGCFCCFSFPVSLPQDRRARNCRSEFVVFWSRPCKTLICRMKTLWTAWRAPCPSSRAYLTKLILFLPLRPRGNGDSLPHSSGAGISGKMIRRHQGARSAYHVLTAVEFWMVHIIQTRGWKAGRPKNLLQHCHVLCRFQGSSGIYILDL